MSYQYRREPLTADEANRLANACSTHQEELIIWTLLDTGLRVSELAGLRRDNMDWQLHRITVYGKGGPYGTKTKRRIIPLSRRAQQVLERQFGWTDRIKISVRTMQRIMKRVANRARISRLVTPHVLRHTFAVSCNQKGISLPVLQKLLGHDHLSSTQVYLNLSPEDVAREFSTKW